jgi:hypothetical protein
MKISCPCSIKTSHNYSSFDFQHGNIIQTHGVLSLETVDFLNPKISSLTIEKVSDDIKDDNFVIIISIHESINHQQIKFLLLSIAQQISFFINLSEQAVNPHHGTFYVDVDLFNVKIENLSANDFQAKIGMQSGVNFDFASIPLKSTKYQELIEFFYEGTRSELPKSKYFHWFLILQYLEYSKKYREQFRQAEHVFSAHEQVRIKKIAEKCRSKRKKDLILKIVQPQHTLKTRAGKLYEFIVDTLNINSFKVGLKTEKINEQAISEIVKTRNNLFHSGVSFNEAILWSKLYPLIVEILKILIIDEIKIN